MTLLDKRNRPMEKIQSVGKRPPTYADGRMAFRPIIVDYLGMNSLRPLRIRCSLMEVTFKVYLHLEFKSFWYNPQFHALVCLKAWFPHVYITWFVD